MNTKDIQCNSGELVLYILLNETQSRLLDVVLAIKRKKFKLTSLKKEIWIKILLHPYW